MGKGGKREMLQLSWEEVQKHTSQDNKWIVINGKAYDITNWSKKHPGGSRVISHYAGQDATDAFTAFHNDLGQVSKYLTPIQVGTVEGESPGQDTSLEEDFRHLRDTAKKMGLFKPSFTFYAVHLGHIIAMEIMAYLVLSYWGTGWIPTLVALALASTVQAQAAWLQHDFGHLSVLKRSVLDHMLHYFTMGMLKAQGGWLQHDFGHLSVFMSSRINHILHYFIIGFMKGASPHWWNHMHYQHHAKPNVMDKDPDVRLETLFVVGEKMPVQVAKNKDNSMPYNWQHRYFFLIGPPLLFPVYFQYMLFRHMYTRKLWVDFVVVMSFYVRHMLMFFPFFGVFWGIVFYFSMRCIESHWFTWVAQSNHIPMNIDEDKQLPWMRLQMHATCDIEKSFFNDWFTGHLNFQIEHHLFPTMPRHNLYKIAPMVQSLCEKHKIPYVVKPLGTAFVDIVRTLKTSGQLWASAYGELHG